MASTDTAAPPSGDDTSDALPAVAPIAGRVPLPRRRPNVVAMMQPLTPAGVPLPRARPADVPATTAPEPTVDVPFYDRGAPH